MLKYVKRRAKPAGVICGFFFGSIGALWSYWFVDSAAEEMARLSRSIATAQAEVTAIGSAESDYFIANGQSDLIFVLAQQPDARREIVGKIYAGNMYDRATPIRNVIGVLAIAKLLDYRQTYDAYEALNDVARQDAALASFVKLKEFERAIVQMAQQHVAELQQRIVRDTQALREIEQAQRSRSAIGVLCSVLGSLILLGTNLLAIQREPPAAPTD
jgi:hypothetical protein